MGKDYQEIDGAIRRWIEAQRLFFVSTAPRADDGRINCSPKGLDSLQVLGPRKSHMQILAAAASKPSRT